MKRKLTSALCAASALVLCLTGCGATDSSGDAVRDNIVANTAAVTSVEATVSMLMEARVGAAGSVDSHTASLGTDITITSTTQPYAYHAEMYSRMLVDGANTRETLEYYVIPEDGEYVEYYASGASDEWDKTILTKEEILALPVKTGYIHDWGALIDDATEVNEISGSDDETAQFEFVGETDPSIIQEIFGNKIFGTFLVSLERLLDDQIPFVLTVDAETYLPSKLTLDLCDDFLVSDMAIDSCEIAVTYDDYNDIKEISVPKKVTVVAVDETADFYASFFAWNLFLPYINGEAEGGSGSAGNSGLSFTSAWNTFQVRLDDGMTQLPLPYSSLNKLGYSIDSSCSSTILEPNTVAKDIPVLKGNDKILCSFYNPETTPLPIVDCSIGSIDVIASNLPQNGVRFHLPGEVQLGITRNALSSAYGEPDEIKKEFSCDVYIWKGETENQSLVAEVSLVNDQVIRLCLTNVPLVSSTTPPDA